MNIKKLTLSIFLIAFILLNFSLVFSAKQNESITNSFFRIHVVANSDSIDDQILKLNIAKEINTYIKILTKNCFNQMDYNKIIQNNIANILQVAKNKLKEHNSNYDVFAYIGKIKYSEKTKDGMVMPSGIYNSLKIVIGNGTGENWWSLLFSDSVNNVSISETLNNDEVSFSYGILELISNFINKIK